MTAQLIDIHVHRFCCLTWFTRDFATRRLVTQIALKLRILDFEGIDDVLVRHDAVGGRMKWGFRLVAT